jgi:O-antigen ligase
MAAPTLAASQPRFDPQGHRMGPIGTIAAQSSIVLALIWSLGAVSFLLLPPTLGLFPIMPILGALLLAPRSVVMQIPVSFSVLGIVGFTVASVAWSIDPPVTMILIRNFVPSMVALALAGAVLSQRDIADALVWTIRLTVALTVAALILVPATRSHAIGGVGGAAYPGWHGFFIHKNNMTPFLAVGIPTVLIFDRNPVTKWGTMSLIAALMIGSTSATGVSGGVFALVVLAWLQIYTRTEDARNSTLLAAMSVLASVAVVAGAIASFATITSAYGRDSNLSGRTDIWEASLTALGERPFFGYGFGALFWRLDISPETSWIWNHVGFEASHAHNGALDLALQIGIVGLIVFTVLYLSVVVGGWRILDTNTNLGIWILSVMSSNFVIGLTEDVFYGGWVGLFVMIRVMLMRRESSLMMPSWTEGISRWSD